MARLVRYLAASFAVAKIGSMSTGMSFRLANDISKLAG
jgi:hypothetical protein